MKGIVFTEFIEMVEQGYGYDLVDELIEESDLPSNGAYTAIGTYEYGEMVQLLQKLGEKTGKSIPDLLHSFGLYLFQTFKRVYPQFLDATDDAFEFLESIEQYIHVEVRKLYPDAELPSFQTKRPDQKSLEMIYHSERKMGAFAKGLIEASLDFYQQEATIQDELVEQDGSVVRFLITKK